MKFTKSLAFKKLHITISVITIFAAIGSSTADAQTTPGSGYGGNVGGDMGAGQGFQGQHGNATSHGSHGGSFSRSGNFTHNMGGNNMTSSSGSFPQNGTAYGMNGGGKHQYANDTNSMSTSNMPTMPMAPASPSASATTSVLPPLQQFRSGVAADTVVCQANFQLILKVQDGSPACVDSATHTLLVERGWGHSP